MKFAINETHDPQLQSWVDSANDPDSDFPIQNLPLGAFYQPGSDWPFVGVLIGAQVLSLSACAKVGLFKGEAEEAALRCDSFQLNGLMELGPSHWSALRRRISALLRADNDELAGKRELVARALFPRDELEIFPPVAIGDYTDFYASVYHATNIGKMFRPDNPLLPNYKWIPIGYHGRASSIVVSPATIRRPSGQTKDDHADAPVFGPSKVLDYELEVGCFIGPGNKQGAPIKLSEAEDHIFGLCLVNDWSARDIQRWEYQPLGPFLSKSFATTISPWIVTLEALAPFRAPAFQRPADDPEPLPYLDSPENRAQGGFDIKLEVLLLTAQMRAQSLAPQRLATSNTQDLYWTFAQMLTHHASNGCNLRAGDLLASGTVSGATKESVGSLIELTQRGTEPITLPTGETRKFLQDGDEVILRAYCERAGFRRIGFGKCRGIVLPAFQ